MSEALEISKYHSSFNEKLSTRVVNDFKKSIGDTVKSKYLYFKSRRSITSDSTTLGTEHVFSINNSYGYVSDFWLEIRGDNSAVFDIGVGGACNCIKEIKIEIGSKTLCTYSGDDLYKMIHLVNRDENIKTELISLMKSGDTNADPLLTPILVPGSNLIYGLDAFDQRSPAWPIGAQNNPLVIRVTLQTGAYISKTNAFVMGSMRLRFMSYAVQNDDIANKKPSKLGLYYSWYFFKPLGNTYTRTLTDATEDQFTIDNVITQGMLNGIVIDVLDRTTKVADMEYQDTEPIDELALKVRGTEVLYEHDSQEEGRLRCLKDWKILNKYNTSASTFGYYYPMALTARSDLSISSIGTKGLNLNLNKPTIYLTCTSLTNSGTAHTVRVLALYKCMYNIKNNKSSEAIIYI